MQHSRRRFFWLKRIYLQDKTGVIAASSVANNAYQEQMTTKANDPKTK
jgi:hypothetical protein